MEFKKEKATVNDHVVLPLDVTINSPHEKDRTVVFMRPDELQEQFGDRPLIWRDDENGTFCLADTVYCIRISIADIKKISIINIIPAKGLGGSYMDIYYSNENNKLVRRPVLFANYRDFNPHRKKIAQLAECEVILEQEQHDC